MADPSSRKTSRPGLLEQASASGSRVAEVIGWLGGHVLRRRAAQMALLIAAAAVAVLVYAFNGPLSREQQIVISVSAGFAVLGVSGAYLAYRSWDFARRMSRRAADADANLREMQATLEQYQSKLADSEITNHRFGRSLAEIQLQHSNLVQAFGEQSSSGLESLSSVRGDIAELDEQISDSLARASRADAFALETRDQHTVLERTLDRTNDQLSVLTSRTDTLSGVVQDAVARVTSIDGTHQVFRQAMDRLEEASATLARSVDADRVGSAVTSTLLKSQIAEFASDNALLIGKLEVFGSQLAAIIQSAGDRTDIQELAEKIAALANSVREFHVREAQRVDQLASKTVSLEALTLSASARTLEELERLRQSTSEARSSFAPVVAAVEQRTSLLESALAAVAQQRQAQAKQIGDLEDKIARNTSNQTAAADDTASQLSSIRQFVGEESGRLAEVAAVYSELRSKVQALETSFVDGSAAIDVVGERIAGLSGELSGVEGSIAEISKRTGLLLASLREEFDKNLADGRVATEGLRKEILDKSGQIARALEEHAVALGGLKEQGEFNTSAEERLAKLARDVASGHEAAASDGRRIEVLEQALSALETSAGSGLDDIRNEISALAARTTGLTDKLHAASEQLRVWQEELAVSIETSAGSVRGDIQNEISSLAARTTGLTDKLHAASEQLRARQEELAASASSTYERVANLERSTSVGANEVDIVKRAVAESTRAQASSTEASRKTTELLYEQFKSIREAMTGEFGRVGALAAKLDAFYSALDQDSSIARNEVQDIKTDLAALSGRMTEVVFGIEARVSEVSQALSVTTDLAELTDRQLVLDAASWFEPNNRKLRADHVESVETDWARRLALDLSRPAIGYMATRINNLERELDGRLRASIEDTLLRTLVARSIKGSSIRVLELGASFGIESAVMYDQLCDHFSQVTFTIVDPLDAFANDTRLDTQTGLPVSERILRRNLSRAGVPDGDIALIRRPSADLQALEEASGAAYDVLLIDADHSHAGVKVDFENYGRLVRLGGYIVFAGYGDPDHPEVTAFVDEEVAASGHVARIGASWHTAVYRVVRMEGGRRKGTVAAVKPATARRRQAPSKR